MAKTFKEFTNRESINEVNNFPDLSMIGGYAHALILYDVTTENVASLHKKCEGYDVHKIDSTTYAISGVLGEKKEIDKFIKLTELK